MEIDGGWYGVMEVGFEWLVERDESAVVGWSGWWKLMEVG